MNQFLLIACTLVVAIVTSAGAGAIAPVVAELDHPRYAYNYAVSDPLTRDNKAQWETRNGDVVKGSYSLVEPDGTLRVVDYRADDLTGFNAVVKKVGPAIHPSGPVAHAPVVAAVAPVVHAPIAVAPVVEHIEPVVHAPLLPNAVAPLTSIIGPVNYGFGAAPLVDHQPKLTSLGQWSLPWDSYTHSYGGWAPIVAPLLPGPSVTIFSKRVVGNDVHKWVTGPIPLLGNKIILKKH